MRARFFVLALLLALCAALAMPALAAKRVQYDPRAVPKVGDGPAKTFSQDELSALESDRILARSDRAISQCAEEAMPIRGQSPVDIALQTEHYQDDPQRYALYDACLLRHGFLPDQADRALSQRLSENPNSLGAQNLPRPEYMDQLLGRMMGNVETGRTAWMTPPSVLLGDAAKAAEKARTAPKGRSYLARYGTIPDDYKEILTNRGVRRPQKQPDPAPVAAQKSTPASVRSTGGAAIVGPDNSAKRPSIYLAPDQDKAGSDGPKPLFLSP